MKKTIYLTILSIVTVLCIIWGSVYHIGNWIFGNLPAHWNLFSDSEGDTSLKSEELTPDEFHSISIDTNILSVTIQEGDSYQISYACRKKLVPEITVKDGKLKVKQDDSFQLNSLFKNQSETNSMTITIPSDTKLEDLKINSDIGNITLDGISAQKLELSLDVGNGEVTDCTFDKTDVEADVGNITLSHCDLGKCELNADTGNIECASSLFTEMKASNDIGNIELEYPASRSYSVDASTELGSVHVNNSNEKRNFKGDLTGENSTPLYKLDLSNSMGNINLNAWIE